MLKLRSIIAPLQDYGIHIYLLFAIYSITIAPHVTGITNFGEKNYWVAICGIVVYVAEFFAFKYKLKMIRLNLELKRAEHKQLTGEWIPIPRVGSMIWLATFMRMVFRVGFIIFSYQALGFEGNVKDATGPWLILFFITFVTEVLLFGYVTIVKGCGFFRDPPVMPEEAKEQEREDERWREEHMKLADSEAHRRKEFYADIVLYIYAFMVYTAFWDYINTYGIESVSVSLDEGSDALSVGFRLTTMLTIMTALGLMPMRLAYWIEESVLSFTKKEKMKLKFYFLTVVLFTIAPTVIEYIKVYLI